MIHIETVYKERTHKVKLEYELTDDELVDFKRAFGATSENIFFQDYKTLANLVTEELGIDVL